MSFDWNNLETGVLIVTTPLLELKFDRGLIFYIKDIESEEVLLNSSYSAFKATLSDFRFHVGFNSWDDPYNGSSNQHERGCSNSYVTPTEVDAYHYRLLFSPAVDFSGNQIANTSIQYDFTIDSTSGEVSIQMTGVDTTGYYPYCIDLPIGNFGKTGSSSIFGSQEVQLSDASYQYWYGGSWNFVPISIGKGDNACFGIWPENTSIACANGSSSYTCNINHVQSSYDQHLSRAGFDAKQYKTDATTINGGPWRITTQANWVEVARRWRLRYLARESDARYLWEHPIEWVRDIHCSYGQNADPSVYDTLAASLGSVDFNSKILTPIGALQNSGNDPWVLTGQISPKTIYTVPSDSQIDSMVTNGYRSFCYFFFDLVNSTDSDVHKESAETTSSTSVEIGTGSKTFTIGTGLTYASGQYIFAYHDDSNQMAGQCTSYNSGTGELVVNMKYMLGSGSHNSWNIYQTSGWLDRSISINTLPVGWDCVLKPLSLPDFAPYPNMTWAEWKTYWADSVGLQYSDYGHKIHPGSTKFQDWMQMWENMCGQTYGYSGGFWDTLGQDYDGYIHTQYPDNQVINGKSYQQGVRSAIKQCQDNGLVSFYEYFFADFLPYVFIGYEGYWYQESYWVYGPSEGANHGLPKTSPSVFYVNHPLRTALIGSFHWTNASLDMTTLVDFDFRFTSLLGCLPPFSLSGDYVDPDNGATFRTLANMFCLFDLFNDLPAIGNSWSDPDVLAYYRSNSGNMFRAEDRGSGIIAYVEERSQGDYDRLIIDDGVVTFSNFIPSFDFTDGVLTITTDMMEMKFKRGAVIGLKNVVTSEYFSTPTALPNLTAHPPADYWGYYLGLLLKYGDSYQYLRPGTDANDVSVSYPDSYTCTVTYINCLNGADSEISGVTLEYTFSVDSVTGEISITVTEDYPVAYSDYVPNSMDILIPDLGYTGSSEVDLIFSTRFIGYDDADVIFDRGPQTGPDCGYTTPSVYAVQAASGCLAVWSENTNVVQDIIMGDHHQSSYNHLILKGKINAKQIVDNKYSTITGPWRFSIQTTWVDVAKRWRTRYNTLWPDAKYLWERNPSWVRNVHCRYSHLHTGDATKWDDVIGQGIAAQNMIVDAAGTDYNGNGDIMPLFGDVTKANALTYRSPDDSEITKLQANNIKYLGYFFHYTLVNTSGIQNRLDGVASGLPVGWDNDPLTYDLFHPDYSGYDEELTGPEQQAAWMTYWDDVSVANGGYSYIHLGSTKAQTTWLQIMRDYCDVYGFNGLFWDELWQDRDNLFVSEPTERIQNDLDFLSGVQLAAQNIHTDLVIVAEYYSHHFMPYVLYTWEGPRTWVALRLRDSYPRMTIDHPFMQALTGSYAWHLDQKIANNIYPAELPINLDDYNHEDFAFMGCIPQFCLAADYRAPTFGNAYYTARAKMFCDYKLFYDLPDSWGNTSTELAYFRSNRTSQIKFVKNATDRYAYKLVDSEQVILQHELLRGVTIPSDPGYVDVVFTDTYTKIPTVEAEKVTGTNNPSVGSPSLTGVRITQVGGGTINWVVYGYEGNSLNYSRGDYSSPPSGIIDLETYYTDTDVTYVTTDDTNMVSQSASGEFAIHQFKVDATGKKGATITWTGQSNIGGATSTAYLQIFDYDLEQWTTIDYDDAFTANTDFTLEDFIADLTQYKDNDEMIACRVYQEAK